MKLVKRLLAAFGVIIAVAAIVLIVVLVVGTLGQRGTGYTAGSVVAGHLAAAVHTQSTVNLANVQNFNFEWDRVYFFSAYTPPDVVEKRVGASLGWRWSSLTDVTEGYTLMVFKRRNRVVAFFDFPTAAGNFSAAARVTNGFSVQEAIFMVTRQPPNDPVLTPSSR